MKLTSLLVASCLLCSTEALGAQSVGDPISGTWSGDAGLSLTQRSPLKVELKFDGKSALTGTIVGPSPATFKAGAFDTTTGALKIEVEVQDGGGPTGRFVFEGTAISGVATGRVSDGTRTGSFKLVKAGAEAAGGSSGGDAALALRKGFADVSGWVMKAAELVPADKYAYQPARTVRTFGQLVAHIADSYNYYCATAAGQSIQWSDPIEKGKTDKATLLPKLRQALVGCTAAYGGNGQAGALLENVGHTNLHYGNMITYLRMLGLVPPSS